MQIHPHPATRYIIHCGLFALFFCTNGIAVGFQKPQLKEAVNWILQNKNHSETLLSSFTDGKSLSKKEAEKFHDDLWTAVKNAAKKNNSGKVLPKLISTKSKQIQAKMLKTGEKQMPFVWLDRNSKKKNRPMFIALHGGGRMNTKTPHGGAVNTREWRTQILFARRLYPDGCVYFVPRMADDRDGRWYYNYCQDAYRNAIEDAVLRHDVDPNRIYLIGISEGAYTAFRLGSFMADRWAGAGSMAGGEPSRNAPPANMRNIAFRADIGEKDTMFDRLGLNTRFGEKLTEFKKTDPKAFNHHIQVHKGRGHGIDYKPCPNWLMKNKRNPWPERVLWENINVHGRRKDVFYWVGIPKNELEKFHQSNKNGRLLIDARTDKKKNSVDLTVSRKEKAGLVPQHSLPVYIYLNDELLDLDKPVVITRNGKKIFSGKVKRTTKNFVRSMAQRRDPFYSFPVRIDVPGKN